MLSSRKLTIVEKKEFARRFVEICGTSEPSEISRLLNISYQAARNYLAGRLPDAGVLLLIAEKTPCSIHWLLTGRGEKFADNTENIEEKMFYGKLRDAAKEGCAIALQEAFVENPETLLPKTVVLENVKVRSEKSRESLASSTFSEE